MQLPTSSPTTRLTPRDRQVIEYLARLRFLDRKQLQDLLFADTPVREHSAEVMTRRVIQRLRVAHLVARTNHNVGGTSGGSNAPVYCLAPAGARLTSRPGREMRAPRGTVLAQHAQATADVILAFLNAAGALPEHEVLDWQTDRDAARQLELSPLVPDLLIAYGTALLELHAFIEIDLGTEGGRVIGNKIDQYLELWRRGTVQDRLGVWPIVLWVTTSHVRARQIARAIARALSEAPNPNAAAEGTEFAITTFADIARHGALAEIWTVVGTDKRRALFDAEVAP